MTTSVEIIRRHIAKLSDMNEPCGRRHAVAWRNARAADLSETVPTAIRHEYSIVFMLMGLGQYVDAYRERYDSGLAGDVVLDEEWLSMAKSFVGLLNGELGRLDGGTLDASIRDISKEAGFEEEL